VKIKLKRRKHFKGGEEREIDVVGTSGHLHSFCL
jgi:hypothetical protein